MMRITTAALAALVTAAAFEVVAAANGSGRAEEILAAARKAIGNGKAVDLRTLTVEAAAERNAGNFQINSDVEILVEMPDKYRRSDLMSGPMSGELTSGFNGDASLQRGGQTTVVQGGGMVIRMGGLGAVAHAGPPPTPEQQEEMRRVGLRSSRHEISRLMLGWFATAHPAVAAEYSYFGEAESPDGKAHVIDVKGADGFAARLFIDQESHLPLMLTYQAPQPRMMTVGGPGRGSDARRSAPATEEERRQADADLQKRMEEMRSQPPTMVEHTMYFGDWREVDGTSFPHRITRSVDGTPTEEWKIEKVRLNPKIDAKKFAVEG